MNPEREPGGERGEQERPDAPRIYVASLSDYNAGRLHGNWLDAAQDVDGLYAAVQAMLAASREPLAEEWAIHDYEGFGPVRLDEYESLERVSRIARSIAEHGAAFAAWASVQDSLDGDALDRFGEHYRGTWDSVEAYAEELLDEFGATEVLDGVAPWLKSYVKLDIDAFARDLELGGDIVTVVDETGVHIFDPR